MATDARTMTASLDAALIIVQDLEREIAGLRVACGSPPTLRAEDTVAGWGDFSYE